MVQHNLVIKMKKMKKYLVNALLLLSLSCVAQSPIISLQDYHNISNVANGTYAKDLTNYYTPYIGIWIWESGNNKLEIKFEKLSQVYNGEVYKDYLIGKYKYTKDGVVLHNSLNYPITSLNYSKYSYTVFVCLGFHTDLEIFSRFKDEQKRQSLNAFFKLINPVVVNGIYTTNTIKMRTSLITHLDFTGTNTSLPGLNYPREVILTKQ